ncbi:MAG: hypothetical protein ACK5LJ_13540 [Paracoccus sp. (in: a-proteobacteria)]
MFGATVVKVVGAVTLSTGLFLSQGATAQNSTDPNPVTTAQTTAAATSPAAPPVASLTMELNRATDGEDGGCVLLMMTTNRLPQGLTRAAWQVAIFDQDGVVKALPVLDFGKLIPGKTKIGVFPIPDGACGTISRVIINDVAECTADDGSDLRDSCLRMLETQSRSDIEFGI